MTLSPANTRAHEMRGGASSGTISRWALVTLGALAEFRNGVNFTKDNFGTGIRIVGVSDFQDYTVPDYSSLDQINPEGLVTDNHLLRDGDVVLVRSNGNRRLIGRSLFISGAAEPLTHSAFTIRARFVSKHACPRFYAYVFRTEMIRNALTSHGGGTNISNLNQGILARLEVPLPPKKVQRKIASILSAYDDLIENNRRRITILEEMAQSLYREWFVDFRFPGHENVRMVDSPLGVVPEGWEASSVRAVCQIVMGQSPPSNFYNTSGEGLPFHQGVTDFGDHFPQQRVFCNGPSRIADAGDILLSVRAPVGRLNLARTRMAIGRGLGALRSNQGLQAFTLYQLKALFIEEDRFGGGTIFKSVTRGDVESLPFVVPPASLAAGFERLATIMIDLIANLDDRVRQLRQTRDLLLPKLISGELNVSELGIDVGENAA
jgi:type I restriction enzyme S subunit